METDSVESAADLSERVAEMTLDDLTEITVEELDELYLWATTPQIGELDGPAEGRALAGPLSLDDLPWMPWKGKIFEPISEDSGQGRNLIESSFFDLFKFEAFEFKTSIVPPLVGDDDVLILDYDIEGNPWIIRQVRDDLKKLRDGLFLGSMSFKRDEGYRFALYFGLEFQPEDS